MRLSGRVSIAGVAALVLSGGGIATQASANTVRPHAWNGHCYTIKLTGSSFQGWCDGKGPESYGTFVYCSDGSDGRTYNSPYKHWFGDRRGVLVSCPQATSIAGYGYWGDFQ